MKNASSAAYVFGGGRGFTIVELLIVIVVIGVLAAIVVTSFMGVQRRAANAVRIDEVKKNIKLFEVYKAQFGQYPHVPAGGYCLGKGFPNGDGGVPRCRDLTGSTSYLESDSAALMAELAKAGAVASSPKTAITWGDGGAYKSVGPYVIYDYDSSGNLILLQINTFLQGGSTDCPADMEQGYSWNSTLAQCRVNLLE